MSVPFVTVLTGDRQQFYFIAMTAASTDWRVSASWHSVLVAVEQLI
jgi:hypothetical protein